MNEGISQFNITYESQQDRLLLRIGLKDNSEILLWLTRRVVKTLWPLLQEAVAVEESEKVAHISDPLQKQVTQEFAHEAAVKELDFSQPYHQERKSRLPHPTLIKRVKLTYVQKTPSVKFEAVDGQVITVNTNLQIILGLIQMLILTQKETGWDLNWVSNTEHLLPPAPSSLH